ncbi:MAG: hypothetical protein LBC39_02600 [Methanobrevibacter sp.]|jgi:hypothetical protein|nr:hypothetical protein [Candidatus Methanovirga aequatorialis]
MINSKKSRFQTIVEKLELILRMEYPDIPLFSIGKSSEYVRSNQPVGFTIMKKEDVLIRTTNICQSKEAKFDIGVLLKLDSEHATYELSEIAENLIDKFNTDDGFKTLDNTVIECGLDDRLNTSYNFVNSQGKRLNTLTIPMQVRYA